MAVLTPPASVPPTAAGSRPARSTRPLGRRVILLAAAVYFVIPLVCAVAFSAGVGTTGGKLSADAYTGIIGAHGLGAALWLTLKLALATIVLVLVLLVPALIAVRLGAPKLRGVVQVVCLLPLVIPGVALGAAFTTMLRWGADALYETPMFWVIAIAQDESFPIILAIAYVVMALPLAYTTIDNGLAAIDLRTLVEAARSCGAPWRHILFSVILPNIRGALLNASFLTLALVLGEYTIAAFLGFQPFAVWTVVIGGAQAQMSVAVSVVGLLATWALLMTVALAARPNTTKESK